MIMQFLYTLEALALGLLALWAGGVAAAAGSVAALPLGFVGAALTSACIVARARHGGL